jgi:hypothetical protein
VKKRFQNVLLQCNLYRYSAAARRMGKPASYFNDVGDKHNATDDIATAITSRTAIANVIAACDRAAAPRRPTDAEMPQRPNGDGGASGSNKGGAGAAPKGRTHSSRFRGVYWWGMYNLNAIYP